MKIAIIYHSETGNTRDVGNIIAEGAKEVKDVEAVCMSIDDIDKEYLEEAKTVIIGCPTYLGNFSWQMKKWFDQSPSCKLGGKLGAMFATEKYIGGGADFVLLTLAGHMLVKGMLLYSGGSFEGQPYTHYGAVCVNDGGDDQQDRARIFGKRIAMKSMEIFTK